MIIAPLPPEPNPEFVPPAAPPPPPPPMQATWCQPVTDAVNVPDEVNTSRTLYNTEPIQPVLIRPPASACGTACAVGVVVLDRKTNTTAQMAGKPKGAAFHPERLRNLVGTAWNVVPCWLCGGVSSLAPRYSQSVSKTRKSRDNPALWLVTAPVLQ